MRTDIGGWKLGVEKAYLEYEPVVGYVKLDLVGHTPQINLREEAYCRDMKCRLCDAHDVVIPHSMRHCHSWATLDSYAVSVSSLLRPSSNLHRVLPSAEWREPEHDWTFIV
jgi:hypothetical protein